MRLVDVAIVGAISVACAGCALLTDSFAENTAKAMRVLSEASWHGNVRQLENVVERAVALSFGKEELGREDLPREVLDENTIEMPLLHVGGDGFSLDEVLASYEQKMLYQALEHAGWVKTRAAELLKIKRTTLIEKMKRLGIPLKAGVPAEPVVAALAEGTDASGVRR